MRRIHIWAWVGLVCLFSAVAVRAQQAETSSEASSNATQAVASVPRLVRFSGVLHDRKGESLSNLAARLTFAIYEEQASGAAALWSETQEVLLDEQGRYTVLLGAASSNGLPLDLFPAGKTRWLGVQVEGREEEPRVLLVSVPYALKAGDAETLAGKPASAFALAKESSATEEKAVVAVVPAIGKEVADAHALTQPRTSPQVTSGTANYLGKFVNPTDLGNSAFYQDPVSGVIGLNTTTPATNANTKLSINGNLQLTGQPTHQVIVKGALSQGRLGQDSSGFFFASDTNGQNIRFLTNNGVLNEWMRITSAGKIGVGTTAPTAKLEVNGTAKFDDLVTFAAGQNFSTTSGTVTAVTGAFTGSTSNQVLNVTQSGTGAAAVLNNTTGGPILSGQNNGTQVFSVDGSGNVQAANINVNAGLGNTFVGPQAGNLTMTGTDNTGTGHFALSSNTTGYNNTATGYGALHSNTTGSSNTAAGMVALYSNTSGNGNTAMGGATLYHNTTGGANTATGDGALLENTTGGGNTASGHSALQSNTTGNFNTATGTDALTSSTTGYFNTATGYAALRSNTTGDNNTACGSDALLLNTTGLDNTAIGGGALLENTTGRGNTASGHSALYFNCQNVPSGCRGNNNTALGYGAGVTANFANANITGANNTFLGAYSGPGTSTELNNATAIGYNALVSASNALALGGTGADAVNVGIGTQTPVKPLHVASGDVYVSTAGSGVIVKSPDGTQCARLGIDNTGALSVTALACP